jgi:hypothetical protein
MGEAGGGERMVDRCHSGARVNRANQDVQLQIKEGRACFADLDLPGLVVPDHPGMTNGTIRKDGWKIAWNLAMLLLIAQSGILP